MGSTLNYSFGNERLDYSKIKIGVKTLNDAGLEENLEAINPKKKGS